MKRTIYKPLGFLFLSLGAAGVVLPVLPTTPFILLAAWFFARSSERWHQWLLDSDMFGPMLHDWEDRRCISCRTKLVALLAMLAVGGASVFLALEATHLRLIALGTITLGCITLALINTCPGEAHGENR